MRIIKENCILASTCDTKKDYSCLVRNRQQTWLAHVKFVDCMTRNVLSVTSGIKNSTTKIDFTSRGQDGVVIHSQRFMYVCIRFEGCVLDQTHICRKTRAKYKKVILQLDNYTK